MGSVLWGNGRFEPISLALHASHYLHLWLRAQPTVPFCPSLLPSPCKPETMQEWINKQTHEPKCNKPSRMWDKWLWHTCSSSWGDGYAAVTAEATAGLTLFSCWSWLLQTWISPDPSLSTRTPLAHEPSMQNGSSACSVSSLQEERK